MPTRRRVHIVVSGRVQGVGYRASAYRRAVELELAGWVRNLRDGRVEAMAEGSSEDITEFIAFCRSGPMAARVDECLTTDLAPEDGLAGFEVLPTV